MEAVVVSDADDDSGVGRSSRQVDEWWEAIGAGFLEQEMATTVDGEATEQRQLVVRRGDDDEVHLGVFDSGDGIGDNGGVGPQVVDEISGMLLH